MAASNGSYRDVEFARIPSTKYWARDLNPHSKDGNSGNRSNGYLGDAPSVIRTGGITGTLPSQSRLPSNSGSTSSAPHGHPPAPPIPSGSIHPPPPPITSQQTHPTTPSASPPRAPLLTQELEKEQEKSQPKEKVFREKKPLPSSDILDALFDRLTKRMKLPPERVAQLNTRTAEHKWSMILAQNEIQAGIACVFYIEQLVRHAQPELKEKRPKKRLLVNLQPLSNVLTDLEVDLQANPNDSWVKDFISTPNHGHVALIDLIKDLADTPQSSQRRSIRKYSMLERDPNCLHTALLCLKALMGHRKAFGAVLKYDPSLCVLAYCLDCQSIRIKILILKMMVTVLLAPGGHRKVMQAFDYFRAIMKERTRFQLLMYSLTDEPADPAYQATVLCFVNTVVQVAQGPNAKVFHQHEFTVAGFNPEEVEKSLHGRQDERILHEIKEWRSTFINVQSYMDDLAVSRGRTRNLQEELEESKQHLSETNSDRESLYKQTRSWIKKSDKQKHKLKEADKTIKELLEVKKERDSLLNDKTQLMASKQQDYTRTSELTERVKILMEENKALLKREVGVQEQVDSLNNYQTMVISPPEPDSPSSPASTAPDTPPPVATPPPATPPLAPPPPPLPAAESPFIPPPPLIPFGIPAPPPPPIGGHPTPPGVTAKKPVVPNVPLPMLNWFPIKNPEHTIFKDLDDENIMETVDFSEFEKLFQVKKAMKKEARLKDGSQRKVSERLTFIEIRRNRNLTIAIRRIGRPPDSIAEAVACTDLDTLTTEHCELLLKFIPTKEELSDLGKHSSRYESFGEAEKFMYHAAKVERYEPRLECMAYLGNFDELLTTTQPQINAVLSASLSILRSSRLKKVFEIILAFGNYMNSSRRGAVHGFKLESLNKIADTRSHDRKQTLLNYIVHMVEKVFPNVLTFHEDLDIHAACSVSMAVVSEDVSGLRQGLKVLEQEMEQDSNNFILFSFHKHARKKTELLSSTFAKMQDAYSEVCLMFSENPKTSEPADFFGIFSKFSKEWKDSVRKNRSYKTNKMASTQDLLKKQEEEEMEPSMTMASLAAEAAAEAAARSSEIRRKVLARDAAKREVQSDGEVGEREEEEGERGDLRRGEERKGRIKEIHEEGERGERRRRRREGRKEKRKEQGFELERTDKRDIANLDPAGCSTPPRPDTPPLPLATPTQHNYHNELPSQDDYYSSMLEHSTT